MGGIFLLIKKVRIMAYVLSKVLNNDICDEINKLVVNETINQLQNDFASEELDGQEYRDQIRGYQAHLEILEDEIEDNKFVDIEENVLTISGDKHEFVDIDAIIVSMTTARYGYNFLSFINIYNETYNISETYNNFYDWYIDTLHSFLDYIVHSEEYNISFDQLFKAKKIYEDEYGGEFNMNNCEYDIKIQVVHILLKKKFQEKETKCVKSVIAEMKEWYENKIKEEKK